MFSPAVQLTGISFKCDRPLNALYYGQVSVVVMYVFIGVFLCRLPIRVKFCVIRRVIGKHTVKNIRGYTDIFLQSMSYCDEQSRS